jgi:hypothetical protein
VALSGSNLEVGSFEEPESVDIITLENTVSARRVIACYRRSY